MLIKISLFKMCKNYLYILLLDFQMKHPLKDTDMYKDKFAQAVMKDVSVIGVNGATGV